MKSNITIKSNIFIREYNDDNIDKDKKFIAQVTGYKALTLLKNKLSDSKGKNAADSMLEPWQKEMLNARDRRCWNDKPDQITYGLLRVPDPKDPKKLCWQGRCENYECDYSVELNFKTCQNTAKAAGIFYNREKQELPPPISDNLQRLWECDDPSIEEKNQAKDIQSPEEVTHQEENDDIEPMVPVEQIEPVESVKSFINQFEKIDDPTRIIEAEIDSKIWVNAAPGSGKTYTVIRRLEHIVDLIDQGQFDGYVLVLTYTRAAKKEILARIEGSANKNKLTNHNIDICTFDSLATNFLANIEASFTNLNYNERIEMFNQKINTNNNVDKFSNYKYVIVDELQDLVNERAKMTLNILNAIDGGYLLLGDRCQAIYDYDCDGTHSVNSVEFYKRLNEQLSKDVLKYELCGNHRQMNNNKLTDLSRNIRCALLEYNTLKANKIVADELEKLKPSIEIKGVVKNLYDITKRTAILCRNNGQAEYVSHRLHEMGFHKHTLLRSGNQPPTWNRFIADCLWDYHRKDTISRDDFIKRYCARVKDDEIIANNAFCALFDVAHGDKNELTDDEKTYIDIDGLAKKLQQAKDLSGILLNENDSLLTVSTVHKAKGREFDRVFLFGDDLVPDKNTTTEESRVWYVGCTRAKNELFLLRKDFMSLKKSKTIGERFFQRNKKNWSNENNGGPLYCCNIVLGLPSDISEIGFVGEKALEIQEYIAHKVEIGDKVEIVLDRSNKVYHIEHINKTTMRRNIKTTMRRNIGRLSKNMYDQLQSIARESNPGSNAPPQLYPMYVSNIVTIIPSEYPDDSVHPYFRKSEFWLGVELTGFPRIDWYY